MKKKCYLCGKPGLVQSNEATEVKLDDGRTHRLPAAEHEYCPHCGERFYGPHALPSEHHPKCHKKQDSRKAV